MVERRPSEQGKNKKNSEDAIYVIPCDGGVCVCPSSKTSKEHILVADPLSCVCAAAAVNVFLILMCRLCVNKVSVNIDVYERAFNIDVPTMCQQRISQY